LYKRGCDIEITLLDFIVELPKAHVPLAKAAAGVEKIGDGF